MLYIVRLLAKIATIVIVYIVVSVVPAMAYHTSAQPNCAVQKCVALTFDDGPGSYTAKLLSILENQKVTATFFVVGNRITAKTAKLLQRMQRDGYEIGNHSWNHANLTKLSTSAVVRQIRRTNQAIKRVIGHNPLVFRPPYGAISRRVTKAIRYKSTMWDLDTLDWKYRNTARIIRVASSAKSGDIVLMHDIHPRTVDAVLQIIKNLKARGFMFVTVSQMQK